MRKITPLPACAFFLAAAIGAGADQLEYTSYEFVDNANNEVFTSGFNVAKTLWQKTAMLFDIEVDRITVPPSDVITGASRPQRHLTQDFQKNRGQAIVGLEQGLGNNTSVSANYYQSREVDYFSQAVIGSFTQDLFQKNTTIQVRGQYTWDDVGEILASGNLVNSFKETHQTSIVLTQLLSPSTVLRVGADEMRLHGLLSDPYRLVVVLRPDGSPDTVKENHPSMRWRQAGWAELSQHLGGMEASLIAHYRYYFDDWGVRSQTTQLKLNKYLTSNLIASPEYRYYIQTGADFGDYAKQNPGAYFTGDYKLQAFDSDNIGLGLTYFLRGIASNHSAFDFLSGATVSLMYFRYWNSLKFHGDVVETKVKFGF